ncbi:hypothetical protein SISNIDRAFT_164355 [Sistotremastrum niveocremeum HHB9708]|uniref:F-box domain-containing protein n=1 Tax=Sistotremastrum niveocremeum HHB9708 TaxID=1314777 RepID=A0A164SFM6_9AGAM|nr:hypothetical protein SISNIDRAFT_164355 [Sistotremastrum niveocremeum HHB9708]
MAVLLRSSGQDVLNLALSAASIMDEKSNLDTSLGRLPNEIIAEILLSYVTSINDPYIGNLSDWTHLMHVCSRWYSIIRNDPRFWRCIDLSWSESTIKRHLSLSGDCLLRLELTLYDKSAHELYNLPLPDLGIMGELLIRTGSDKNHLWIRENDPVTHAAARCAEAILRCEAPHLSRLSVQYDYASCVEEMEDLPFPSIRHLSSLEFLQLRGYIVIDRWSQTFPTSLRDIHIGKSSYARNAKHTISVSNIFCLLEDCPNLELLDITGSFPEPVSGLPVNEIDYSLSQSSGIIAQKLRRLSVSGLSCRIGALCSMASMPLIYSKPTSRSCSPHIGEARHLVISVNRWKMPLTQELKLDAMTSPSYPQV